MFPSLDTCLKMLSRELTVSVATHVYFFFILIFIYFLLSLFFPTVYDPRGGTVKSSPCAAWNHVADHWLIRVQMFRETSSRIIGRNPDHCAVTHTHWATDELQRECVGRRHHCPLVADTRLAPRSALKAVGASLLHWLAAYGIDIGFTLTLFDISLFPLSYWITLSSTRERTL